MLSYSTERGPPEGKNVEGEKLLSAPMMEKIPTNFIITHSPLCGALWQK